MEVLLGQNCPRMRDRGLEVYHVVSHGTGEEPLNTCAAQAIRC
jgi:hypothetical protein